MPTIREQIEAILRDLVHMTQTDEYPGEREDRIETATKAIEALISQSVMEELEILLSNVPMPTLSYEQVGDRIKELKTLANKGDKHD